MLAYIFFLFCYHIVVVIKKGCCMIGEKIDFAQLSESQQNEIIKVIKTDFKAAKNLYMSYINNYKKPLNTYKTNN